jgi:Tol biopolymer transport system component
MPDGRIICNKLVMTSSQQLYGPGVSESHSYIAAMNPDGSGETNLFEGGVGNEITCSPTGELIAGIVRGTGEIVINDYTGKNEYIVPNTSNVWYLDWSPDGTKLVYNDINRNLYVINRDGSGKVQITTSAEAVAWRAGTKIVYEYAENGYIYLGRVNVDGTSKESYGNMSVYSPQVSTVNSNHIYGKALSAYRRLDVSNVPPTEDVLISSFEMYKPKLSFDNNKIISGAYGDPGIWIINIDGTGDKKLR